MASHTVGVGRPAWPLWARLTLTVLTLLLGLVLLGLGTGFFDRLRHTPATMSGGVIGSVIGDQLTTQVGQEVTVDCPATEPARAGFIFDCVAPVMPDGSGFVVRVTENDAAGHVTWQVTGQRTGSFMGNPFPVPPQSLNGTAG